MYIDSFEDYHRWSLYLSPNPKSCHLQNIKRPPSGVFFASWAHYFSFLFNSCTNAGSVWNFCIGHHNTIWVRGIIYRWPVDSWFPPFWWRTVGTTTFTYYLPHWLQTFLFPAHSYWGNLTVARSFIISSKKTQMKGEMQNEKYCSFSECQTF